ncbi:CubicO group peptidase (beta-lactamase class C family) [Promicromonospora sp. AC04]|uniref:serine hydrolase domain-containing protein n=1 Tax=Promicromonospora sp. AC04 TaxID=2135723 RepID=UPI000D345A6A|nr:serine hydrolase domain-containing protein [Promicromonospora sp. AC04]PUB24094.1 CubicO group peptidase (beta-lactamase class C family) [Promicromonospora sp. AC04]
MGDNAAGSAPTRVQAAVDRLVADGGEVGLQVAVIHRGGLVVDAVSGLADAEQGLPVTPHTLFFAASTAKGVASAVAHVLVERGELTYDLRVADVWPEFAAHGKGDVTLRHVLMHTAGVPAPPYTTTAEDLCDWDRMCSALADAEPWWEPGTRFGYHAQTFGFLLGETVRRATGRSLSWWLRAVVTGPLGVEDDVHFGVAPALLGRVARQEPAIGPPSAPEPGSPADRAVPPGIRASAALANRRDVLTSDIPSQGTVSARGAARVFAGLLGHTGVPLVSPARLAELARPAFEGPDEVMGMQASWAFGFSPQRPSGVPSRAGSAFGMLGANGSGAWADIDSGVAVAVLRNRFSPDWTVVGRIDRLVAELFPTPPRGET